MVTPELVTYIKGEVSKGRTREDIRQTLIANGWTDVDVGDAFRQVFPMSGNVSAAQVISPKVANTSSIKPKSILTLRTVLIELLVLTIIVALGATGYFSRAKLMSLWHSTSQTSQTSNIPPQAQTQNSGVAVWGKDCGVTSKPDPNIPSSYENNQVLTCLGASIVHCSDAEATISDNAFPTDFKVSKDSNSCNFTLSYPSDSTLTDITGKQLAGQAITCPVSIVKTLDNTNPKAPVFNTASTANLSKYASDVYFYGTLGVFIENNVDETKIYNAGCSGDYISSVVASYQKMQSSN